MSKIPKELAERLYDLYATTLVSPLPFNKWNADKMRRAFETGIVKPEEQLLWIYHQHVQAANHDESYDLGVLNALELLMFIFNGRDPDFVKKPKSQQGANKSLKNSLAKFKKLKAETDSQISALEKDLKEAKDALKKSKSEHAADVRGLKAEIAKKSKKSK